jgi:hypothetical protein
LIRVYTCQKTITKKTSRVAQTRHVYLLPLLPKSVANGSKVVVDAFDQRMSRPCVPWTKVLSAKGSHIRGWRGASATAENASLHMCQMRITITLLVRVRVLSFNKV